MHINGTNILDYKEGPDGQTGIINGTLSVLIMLEGGGLKDLKLLQFQHTITHVNNCAQIQVQTQGQGQ